MVPNPGVPGLQAADNIKRVPSSRCLGIVSSSVSVCHSILPSRSYLTSKQWVRYYSIILISRIKTCGLDLLCSLFFNLFWPVWICPPPRTIHFLHCVSMSRSFCLFLYFLNDRHTTCHHFGSKVITVNWGCFESETDFCFTECVCACIYLSLESWKLCRGC